MEGVSRSPLGCTTETLSPASFVKWCSKNKVMWEQCNIAVSDVTGRCLVAKQHIREGEVVVEVPDSQVLMAENSQINELLADCGLLKPADDALLEVQGLILAVMYEKALGKKSHWQPYLSFLPTDMSHMIVYWTDAELSELRGTAAYDKLIGRVQHPADAPTRMRQLFEELVLPFVQSHESVCKTLLGKKPDKCSEEEATEKLWPLYQWSTSVVASYSFVLGDDQYQGMVPVWDLLNHVTGQVNVRLHHDADREVLQMVATADIPAGAEVVNCYGQLSNAELLRGYGFVEQHNMIKHVHVPAQFLIRAAAAAVVASEAAAAAGRGDCRKRKRDLAADRDDQEDQATDPSHQAESSDHDDHDDDQDHDESDNDDDHDHDESSDEDDDESSDQDDDEPDWDLEDDSSEDYAITQQQQQQQQQGVSIPRLAAAQNELADWEDRWQLCHFLKLLPKNNVFQVPAGGLAAVQGNLLAALLLLLADGWACEQLAAAAIAATSKAAEAAAEAAAAAKEKHSKVHKGKKHRKQQQQQEQDGSAACDAAAAAVAEVAAKASRKLAKQEFDVAPSLLLSALKLLIQLMLSRYNCSLERDYQQQQDEERLPPRLAAAVMARIGEKEVLHQLIKELEQGDNGDGDQDDIPGQLMTSARQALTDALQQAVMSAAAAASSGGGGDCCGVPGCSHEHEKEQQREQQQQQQHADDKRDKPGDEDEFGLQSDGKQQQKQKEKKKKQKQPDGGQKGTQKQASSVSAAAAAESLPQDARKKKKQKGVRDEQQQQQAKKRQAKAFESNGFAFNFQM